MDGHTRTKQVYAMGGNNGWGPVDNGTFVLNIDLFNKQLGHTLFSNGGFVRPIAI